MCGRFAQVKCMCLKHWKIQSKVIPDCKGGTRQAEAPSVGSCPLLGTLSQEGVKLEVQGLFTERRLLKLEQKKSIPIGLDNRRAFPLV